MNDEMIVEIILITVFEILLCQLVKYVTFIVLNHLEKNSFYDFKIP